MPNGMALDARAWPRAGADVDAARAIVMGLDQHRAQITAEWIDTATGEIGRCRVAPGDRLGVRQFLARFSGRQLEVALEATTGWWFVVEELTVGALPPRPPPARRAAQAREPRMARAGPAAAGRPRATRGRAER